MNTSGSSRDVNFRPVVAMARATASPHWEHSSPPASFVTVSDQYGSGGLALARALADRLNARDRHGHTPVSAPVSHPPPWTVWDHELVDKIATEYHLPAALVESLEEAQPSWLAQLLASLPSAAPDASQTQADEYKVYRRVAVTIRALAEVGGVIILGRGGAFITRGMPGGVHVRVVAPVRDRARAVAGELGVSPDVAAAAVRERDERQAAFYHRHWPTLALRPENFTVTFNAAGTQPAQLAECVLPLVAPAAPAPAPAAQPDVAGAGNTR
jgi:hypothetical protein